MRGKEERRPPFSLGGPRVSGECTLEGVKTGECGGVILALGKGTEMECRWPPEEGLGLIRFSGGAGELWIESGVLFPSAELAIFNSAEEWRLGLAPSSLREAGDGPGEFEMEYLCCEAGDIFLSLKGVPGPDVVGAGEEGATSWVGGAYFGLGSTGNMGMGMAPARRLISSSFSIWVGMAGMARGEGGALAILGGSSGTREARCLALTSLEASLGPLYGPSGFLTAGSAGEVARQLAGNPFMAAETRRFVSSSLSIVIVGLVCLISVFRLFLSANIVNLSL